MPRVSKTPGKVHDELGGVRWEDGAASRVISVLGASELSKNMRTKRAKMPRWFPDVEEHDYPAAESYLNLIYSVKQAARLVAQLRDASVVQFKAKDIFRASGLSLLGVSNTHVEKDRKKIQAAKCLSPLLLVRDEKRRKVVIADGYHRLCAIYQFDEDAMILCKIV
jgi:disulfide oxidoreductase YuzD